MKKNIFLKIINFELKKFLPMSFLMFSILFVYAAVRDLKDVFVQSYAALGGTELIAPLKGLFVLPTSLIVAVIFAAVLSKFGMQKTFYITVSFFAIFFFVFAFAKAFIICKLASSSKARFALSYFIFFFNSKSIKYILLS